MSTILRSAIEGLIPTVNQLETTELGIGYNRADAALYGLRVSGGSKSVVLLGGTGSGESYVHPTYPVLSPVLTGASVLASLTSDALGHLTAATTREMSCGDIGAATALHTHPFMVTGNGTLNYLAKWGVGGLCDSSITENNGSVLFTGTTGVTPVSGAGTRLMWIPSKAAFRAGAVNGSDWDNQNIGLYSVAMGFNCKASGIGSFALGTGCIAEGQASIAMGMSTTASAAGGCAIAIGPGAIAEGYGALAIGGSAIAAYDNAMALGGEAMSYSEYSVAIGFTAAASGDYSLAIGSMATTEGFGSFALGYCATVTVDAGTAIGANARCSGNQGFAIGYSAGSNGTSSLAIGFVASASSSGDTAIGMYAQVASVNYGSTMIAVGDLSGGTYVQPSTWLTQDNTLAILGDPRLPLFVGINNVRPSFTLDVSGDIRIRSSFKLLFGGTGSADADVNLYKSSANQLKTDDGFVAGSYLTVTGETYHQGGIQILNKAGTAFISLATRNTAGSQAVYDFTSVGSVNLNNRITSTLASGISPFAVSSTTLNVNLNADLLDGQHSSYFSPATHTHSGYLTALTDGIFDGTGSLYAPYTSQPLFANTPITGIFYNDSSIPNTKGNLRYSGTLDASSFRGNTIIGTDYIDSGAYLGNGGMVGGNYEGGIYAYANDAVIAVYSNDGGTDTFYYAAGMMVIVDGLAQFSGALNASRMISTIPTGTAPVTVTSATVCTNLNADMLDGHHWSEIPTGGVSGAGAYNRLAIWNTTSSLTSNIGLRIATYTFGDCVQFTLPFWATDSLCVGSVIEYGNSPVQIRVVSDHNYAGLHITRQDDLTRFGAFINFKGTIDDHINSNIMNQGYEKYVYKGMVKISVNDAEYWMPYFSYS